MAVTIFSSSARALQRHRLPDSSNICRRCLRSSTPSFYRSLTTVSHTLDTEEPPIPSKLAHSLGYRTGPQSRKDFIKIANERRAVLKSSQPQREAPTKRRQTAASIKADSAHLDSAIDELPVFLRLPHKKTPPTSPIAPRHEPEQESVAVDTSLHELLPLLRCQPPFYAQVLIHGKPYLVTLGDKIQLPFLMHGVQPGDVLRLDRIGLIGSRDYTLKAGSDSTASTATVSEGRPSDAEMNSHGEVIGHSGAIAKSKAESSIHHGTAAALPTLPAHLYTIRATVLGVETEPMRIMEKTKRRQRHVRKVKSKHRYTVLAISDLQIHGLEETAQVQADLTGSPNQQDSTMQEQLHEGEGELKDIKPTPEAAKAVENTSISEDAEPASPEKMEDQLHKTGP